MPEPTTPSLAWKMEEWAIQMLRQHETFPAELQIVHGEEDEAANIDRLVLTASIGDREAAGLKPWNVSLEIKAIIATRDEGTADSYMRAVADTFDEPPTVPELSFFDYLNLIEEDEEEKDTRPNTRQRAKVYNFHAIEAPLFFIRPNQLMFVPENDLMFA